MNLCANGVLYTASGGTERCLINPFLGIGNPFVSSGSAAGSWPLPEPGLRLGPLGPVFGPALLAVRYARRVERPANNMVADTGQVLYASASDQYNRVFLKVVAHAGDVGSHLNAVRQPHARHLPQRRIGLLGRGGIDAGANTPLLRTRLQRGAGCPVPLALSS